MSVKKKELSSKEAKEARRQKLIDDFARRADKAPMVCAICGCVVIGSQIRSEEAVVIISASRGAIVVCRKCRQGG